MTLLYAVISGIPKTVAGFGGGILTEAFGFKISILFAAVLCAIMVIPALALPSDMLKKEKNSFDEIENKNK